MPAGFIVDVSWKTKKILAIRMRSSRNNIFHYLYENIRPATNSRRLKSLGGILRNKRSVMGKGNVIEYPRLAVFNCAFIINSSSNTIRFGAGSLIKKISIIIYGSDNYLKIGNNCSISDTTFWIEDCTCKIIIGDSTTIEGAKISVTEDASSIVIGEDCMLSYDVDIRSGDSHSIIDLRTNQRINRAEDIVIGDHVWIGAHVQILKGVTIGDNSVIGTGSVVTSDVSAKSIAPGIPARVIREGTTWKRERE